MTESATSTDLFDLTGKVAVVTGDGTRLADPIAEGEGRQYLVKARGKRGIPLDLSSDEGRKIALDLAANTDGATFAERAVTCSEMAAPGVFFMITYPTSNGQSPSPRV